MKSFLFLCLAMVIHLCAWAQQTKLQVTTNGGFENRINSYIGNTFTRDIEIFNVQSGSFTGYIKIKENSGSSLKGSMKIKASVAGSVSLVDVIPANADANKIILPIGNPVGLDMIAAQDNEIVIRVVNFKQNLEKVFLHQDLTVTGCLNSNNISKLSISFVETPSITVPQASEYTAIDGAATLSQAVYAGDAPVHKVFDFEASANLVEWYDTHNPILKREQFYCTGNNNFQTMTLSLGLSDLEKYKGATFHNFKLEFLAYDSDRARNMLFTIDRTSISIEKRSNDAANTLLSSWSVSDQKNIQYRTNDPTSESCLTPDQKFEKLTYELGELGPNEHYQIKYDLYNCCKKNDLFDGKVLQNLDYLWFTFADDCGGFQGLSGQRLLGPNQASSGAGLDIKSKTNSSPASLGGVSLHKTFNDLGNFVVDNDLSLQNYFGLANGEGFVYNELTAELVVRIKSGPGLRYISKTSAGTVGSEYYDFGTNPGGFSFYPAIVFADKYISGRVWNPVNPAGDVITGSAVGYEMREFRFKLSEMPDVTDPTNRSQIYNNFPNNFNSMQLNFSMVGLCSDADDGSWEVQFLFDTDKSCSECLQPISKVFDNVVVVCPGCKVPGAAATGNAQRSFYGPYDANNDGIPDAGETETSIHTLSEVLSRNNNGIASDDIQTTLASVNDDITFSSHFYLTEPTDCNAGQGGRIACRDNELQYQWAYLQVRVPKGYMDPSISQLDVLFRRAGATLYAPIANSNVIQFYYEGSSQEAIDVFYLKVNVASTGFSYFLSGDAFDISFHSKVIKNVADRERQKIGYTAYFTKAEEILSINNPVFNNRSYADCSTGENRGINPTCDTESLQMICETWGSYLTFISINTAFFSYPGTGFTEDKTCVKYLKANSLGSYAGEKSNFGNPDGFGGLNLYKNEFRKAPQLEFIDIVLPKGYFLHEIQIGTSINNNSYVEEDFFIRGSDLSGLNKTKNEDHGTERVLHFDIRNFYSLADGNSNVNKPLHYSDESFQPMAFYVLLAADCKYLSTNGILQTDLGSISNGNGGKIYSTVSVDNPFVGNQGLFNISGDNQITQSPLYNVNTAKFKLNKLGAEDNEFKIQKKTSFVNEFDFIQILTPNHNEDNFGGNIFLGVNPIDIVKCFSVFKIENVTDGSEIVNINPALGLNKSFDLLSINYGGGKKLRISGSLNLNVIVDCNADKKAIYDLFYGINCDESAINAQSVIDGSLCNAWKERIELKIDGVDMLLTTNETTYPIIAGNVASHQAIFTATRSQINQMEIQLSHSFAVETTIQKLRLVKNTGTAVSYLDLVVGDNYSISSDNTHIIIHTLPEDAIFESLTDGENYYNQVELVFDIKNTSCTAQNVQTQIAGNATPFYSATLCKIARQSSVQSPLIADVTTVQILGTEFVCPGTSGSLTAQITGALSSGATLTWYKEGNVVPIQGPDGNNMYSYTGLVETTKFIVVLTNGNCTSTDDITVTVYPVINITIIAPNEFCIGSAPVAIKGLPEGGYFTGAGVSYTLTGGYTFSATVPGDYLITYFYTDPLTGCQGSKTHLIVVSACCKYALAPTEVMCGEDAIRCITLKAVKPVDDGIKGMDFTLMYDRTLMRPTGIPGRGNATLGNVVLNNGMANGMGSYAMTEKTITGTNFNQLNVSIFYSSQAPSTADFDGIGDVICIEFKILGSATTGLAGTTKSIFIGDFLQTANSQGVAGFSQGVVDDEHKVFMVRSCVENNGVGVISILKNNLLNGKVYYHNDANAPLRYDATTNPRPYLATTITPVTTGFGSSVCNPSAVAPKTTDINGAYSIDLTGANGVKVSRDITGDYYNSCTNPSDVIDPNGNVFNPSTLLVAINGYDAYLMESITTMRAPSDVVYVADRKVPTANSAGIANSLFPTPFQMIASDVNMDRTVRAVDITLVQERAVSKLCEYPQVWNYTLGLDPSVYPVNTTDQRSLDWRFVDKSQVLSNLSYQKSGKYPLPGGMTGTAAAGYWRDNVPSPSRCLMGPAANQSICKSYASTFDIHAIMLGDIDGSWRANINGSQKNLRTESDNKVVVKAGNKQQIGLNTFRIPVTFVSLEPATVSLDFALDYKEEHIRIQKVGSFEAADQVNAQVVYNDFENKQLLFTSYTMSQLPTTTPVYYLDVVAKNGTFDASMLGSGDAYLNGQRVDLVVEGATVTGVDNPLSGTQYGFDLIPNPTANEGEIVYNIKMGSKAKIVVYNTLGQIVSEYSELEGQGNIQVATSAWSSGMYQVILFTENAQQLVKKWVIQN